MRSRCWYHWMLVVVLSTGTAALCVATALWVTTTRGDENASPAPVADKPAAATDTPVAGAPDRDSAKSAPAYTVQMLQGRLVWMGEALARLHKIESDADAAETQIALETKDGRLVPIVKDFRSRGFWLDPRLRQSEVELEVRHYDKTPAVQIVRWYAIRQGRKYELDYWCDICAIPMYELKTCDCCQGEIRLRERPVDENAP
ncbi:MAG TPA: hypothetical protein VGN12_16820 [Pirellulales bacterium]